MTSREIVIDLIDKGLITGEQAFTLINDIVAAEIKEAIEILNASKKNSEDKLNISPHDYTGTVQPNTITTTSSPNWIGGSYTYTDANSANSTLTSTLLANANSDHITDTITKIYSGIEDSG